MTQHELLILYGSQTGNAHYIAEEIEREAITKNFKCYITSCDSYNIKQLPTEKHVIFVVSTTGQGDMPDNMLKMWQFLLIKDLPADSLKNIKFTVFGLGDSNYQLFNAAARKLHRRLLDLGATEFVERGLGDDQHPQGYYNAFDIWMTALWDQLQKEFPEKNMTQQQNISSNNANNNANNNNEKMDIEETNPTQNSKPPVTRFKISYVLETEQIKDTVLQSYKQLHQNHQIKPYNPSLLVNKELLTPQTYERGTYKMDFNIENSGLIYSPGDILVVHPSNDKKLCLDLAGILKVDLNQIIEISVNPEHPSKFNNPYPQYIRIFDLFSQWLDISAYPNRYLLKLLSYYTEDPLHKERLEEMSARSLEGSEDFYEYVVRERRNIHEILFDFQQVQNFPLEYLLESIQLLVPRKYSISSSQQKDKNQVSLTLGMVKYETLFKRQIVGTCSRYLEDLALNQRALLQIQKGTMNFPRDLTTPVIMVGPGTGVAPFLSFIEDRVEMIENLILNKQNKPEDLNTKTILFFGCRHKSKDFYYGDNLESLHELNMMTLYTAFSRDQSSKVYVQHLIEQNWQSLFQIIQKNFETVKIFVSGTSKFMPQQVEEAFTNVIFKGNKQNDISQAKNIIEYLKRKKQYVVEAW